VEVDFERVLRRPIETAAFIRHWVHLAAGKTCHQTCGHGDPILTREGGGHMVLRKAKVQVGNSG
jgi:hypothetical protein